MGQAWKTVRVFISSTFRDMHAERDHLVRFVFPQLREELLKRRIHLVDVDLRWGVTSEQDALEVCREIIDECRPRFLCMLGGRYGWVPPGKARSITADEVHYGVLDRTPRDRGFAFFYFRDDAVTATMAEATPGEFRESEGSDNQRKLAELKRAIVDAGLNRCTYEARWDSETRRLIDLKDFGERVYADLLASMRSDPDLADRFGLEAEAPLDEFAEENAAMEAFVEERCERFVLGSREGVLNDLIAHVTSTGGNGYLCLTGPPGSGKSALLSYLSRHLRLSDPLILLIAHFVGTSPGSTDVRRTVRRLCHELRSACPDITADVPEDPEELRIVFPYFLRQASALRRIVILLDAVNQLDFTSRSLGLTWLPPELPANARIILSTQDGPAWDDLRQRSHAPREIKLEPLTSVDGEAIIEQFLHRFSRRMTPEQFRTLMERSEAGTPLYLLVALEELRTLSVSRQVVDSRDQDHAVLELIAELPPTTQELFGWILQRLMNDEGFRDAKGRKIGQELVPRFAALLGVSRHGLSQQEFIDLLAPGEPTANPPREPDSQGNVAALLHLLRPYLMRRGELLDFYHSQFRTAVLVTWLGAEDNLRAAHAELVGFFRSRADPTNGGQWDSGDSHAFLELPYHLKESFQSGDLRSLLLTYRWLEGKLRATDIQPVLEDFRYLPDDRDCRLVESALGRAQTILRDDPAQLASQLHARLLVLPPHVEITSYRSEGVGEYAQNSTPRSPNGYFLVGETPAMTGLLASAVNNYGPWFRPVFLSFPPLDARLMLTVSGHGPPIGALSFRSQSVFEHWDDWRVEGWSREGEWFLRSLTEHAGQVMDLSVSPDGSLAVSGSGDWTMRVWDLVGFRLLRTIETGVGGVGALAIAAGGDRVLSGLGDGTLREWDLETGRELRKMCVHHAPVTSVAPVPGGRLAASAAGGLLTHDASLRNENTMVIWDFEDARVVRTLRGHEGSVRAIAVTGDGRRLVSGSSDHTVRVWDLETGAELWTMQGHTASVEAVAVTTDGRQAVSGSLDQTLRIWDLESGQQAHTLIGHQAGVNGVAVARTGLRAISASEDCSVKVWDTACGACICTFTGESPFLSCACSSDGGLVLAGTRNGRVCFLHVQEG